MLHGAARIEVMKKFIAALILLLSLSSFSEARQWQRMDIPGAVCGNGLQYSIFVDLKPSSKLYVELMSGGACWSTWSCYGPRLRTWIHQMPQLPSFSVMSSSDETVSPAHDHSAVYFPYCTGDVYAGTHTAVYQFGAKVHHHGKLNIQKAFRYLKEQNLIAFEGIEELTIYGASAGAIGSFMHAKMISGYTPNARTKRIISDSPGLHFGPDFWDKFPPRLAKDIYQALDDIQFEYDPNDGLVAPGIPSICEFYHDFSIGILQASQDIIMSRLFGEITMSEHEELVYSPKGVYEQTKKVKNCAVWAPSSKLHTFLILPQTADYKTSENTPAEKEAMDFARDIFNGKTNRNYK